MLHSTCIFQCIFAAEGVVCICFCRVGQRKRGRGGERNEPTGGEEIHVAIEERRVNDEQRGDDATRAGRARYKAEKR